MHNSDLTMAHRAREKASSTPPGEGGPECRATPSDPLDRLGQEYGVGWLRQCRGPGNMEGLNMGPRSVLGPMDRNPSFLMMGGAAVDIHRIIEH